MSSRRTPVCLHRDAWRQLALRVQGLRHGWRGLGVKRPQKARGRLHAKKKGGCAAPS